VQAISRTVVKNVDENATPRSGELEVESTQVGALECVPQLPRYAISRIVLTLEGASGQPQPWSPAANGC
jgi:hypothetical protein